MRTSLSYRFSAMARSALGDKTAITETQLVDLGVAARAMFEAAWTAERHDHALMRNAIFAVVQTFESDAAASEELLRRLLTPERIADYGYEDIPDLAHELASLHTSAPAFCVDVYATAFSRNEDSNETTVMTSGVVGLTSTRGQDWRGARYALAHDYPDFLEKSPEAAVDALIVVRNAYVQRRGYARYIKEQPEDIDLGDKHTAFLPDAGMHDIAMAQEDESTILSAFTERLTALATEEPQNAAALINVVLDRRAPAAVWRSMFSVGAKHPEAVVSALGKLSTAPAVLQAGDLSPAVPHFLSAAYPLLTIDQRRLIEDRTIEMDTDGWREHHRNLLLASLPEELIVTDAVQALRDTLDVEDALRTEGDDFEWESLPFDERARLREQGVDVDSNESKRLDALAAPVKEFADTHLNKVPTLDDAHAITAELAALREALKDTAAHELHRSSAWEHLSRAAREISRQSELNCDDDTRAVVLGILLAAAERSDPAPRDNDAANFDEAESWGNPASRADAVDGLMRLASRADCNDASATDAIEALAADPSTVVRFHAAQAVAILANGHPDLSWRLVDQLATDESLLVRQATVSALSWMGRLDKARVVATTKAVYQNAGDKEKSPKLRITALNVLTQAYVRSGDAHADGVLVECLSQLPQNAEVASAIVFPLREVVTAGAIDGSEPDIDAQRLRAIGLIDRLLTATLNAQADIEQPEPRRMEEWSEERLQQWQGNAQIIDKVNLEFFFASGAHRDQTVPESGHVPTPAQARFYDEAGALADRIATVGHPRVAHHLLETLEFFIDIDPRGVFLRIAATIHGGQKWGYQYDNLAGDLFVRIVERYLAEHRTLLQQDAACSAALVEILDIFVRAGWLSARRLTYGLDEIYR